MTLAYYRSNASKDVWVTSAAVPPYHGYERADEAFDTLPLLASSVWTEGIDFIGQHAAEGSNPMKPGMGNDFDTDAQADASALISPKMISLYDCFNVNHSDHFVSNSSTCDSQKYLRILGYVLEQNAHKILLQQQLIGIRDHEDVRVFGLLTKPIYACYNATVHNSCVDVDQSCSKCGGHSVGLLGYGFALPPE